MAIKEYQGSCHCGRIRYQVQADLDLGTYKCNCSYCAKVRNWGGMVKPSAFQWLTGESELGIYQITPNTQNFYYFCKHCGIRLCTKGYIEEIGGDYLSFMISTLNHISHSELAELKVQYMDGANNDWFHIPKVTKHL